MPTILSHPAAPIALAMAMGTKRVPVRLLAVGVLASVLPDIDVVGLRLGVPYGDAMGHRGASHSVAVAALFGLLVSYFSAAIRLARFPVFVFVFMAGASHGLLDMLTNGGHGVAVLWPWSESRYFFGWQVIEVSPLSLRKFMGPEGWQVLKSEMVWVWVPALIFGMVGRFVLSRYSTPGQRV